MRYHMSYRNPQNGDRRHLFELNDHNWLVVKEFGENNTRTVKIWSASGFPKGVTDRWNTVAAYRASVEELSDVRRAVSELIAVACDFIADYYDL